ncbi:MAG TPA: hypothetical protein VEU95_06080 [Micropepsaceae bacterium]|nr:hypothetical protein [Micropepsaceae bacterium]
MLLAECGNDADWIGELAIKKGTWADIPPKSNRNDPICFISTAPIGGGDVSRPHAASHGRRLRVTPG